MNPAGFEVITFDLFECKSSARDLSATLTGMFICVLIFEVLSHTIIMKTRMTKMIDKISYVLYFNVVLNTILDNIYIVMQNSSDSQFQYTRTKINLFIFALLVKE